MPYAQSAVEQAQHGAAIVGQGVGSVAQAVRERAPALPSLGGTAATTEGADTVRFRISFSLLSVFFFQY